MNLFLKQARNHLFFSIFFLAPLLIISNMAFAQDNDQEDDEIEEIVVTGYKASLETAKDVKKNADRIVDSIVALDVGKLPDSNVA